MATYPLARWSLAHYTLERLIRSLEKDSKVVLVSGGDAWGHSLAIRMYISGIVKELELFMPAPFSFGSGCFIEAGPESPGKISNDYHRMAVQRGCPYDGLHDLKVALQDTDKVTVRIPGNLTHLKWDFYKRNRMIAERVDGVYCTVFGKGKGIPKGGTRHTCKAFLERPILRSHVSVFDLSTGEVYLSNLRGRLGMFRRQRWNL